jgi:uncharacterized protein with HEPN domain
MKDNKLSDRYRILHIREAIARIYFYISNIDEIVFLEDLKTQDSILYQFVIISEAVTYSNPDLLRKYPYEWYKVKAFRNYAVHRYFNINMSAVWNVIVNDLKILSEVVENILKKEYPGD